MSSIFDAGKKAKEICTVPPEEDNLYELDIHSAACYLVRHDRGESQYLGHYQSGTTHWAACTGPDRYEVKRQWVRTKPE